MTAILTLAREALADDARVTPGPWSVEWLDEAHDGCDGISSPGRNLNIVCADCGVYGPHGYDAEFIAAARSREPQLARAVGELSEENERLKARLNPTIEQHDANPAGYWADHELKIDERGFRVATLADCDLPKYHLRLALDEIEHLNVERRQNGSILSNVNDAIGRAGIHCAITFVEAIDQIAGDRDDARSAFASLLVERDRLRAGLKAACEIAAQLNDDAGAFAPSPEKAARIAELAKLTELP